MNKIKQLIKRILNQTVRVVSKTKVGGYFFELVLNQAMDTTQTIVHNGTKLNFSTPNSLNRWRVKTFSTKEPETLEWIDAMPEHSILWDIGANIGLYSCYAASHRKSTVFAFEPSIFNLELLARNVFLNVLSQKVTIIPLPLSDTLSISAMRMTSTEWGGALSTFGKKFGWDGKPIKQLFEFTTLGFEYG